MRNGSSITARTRSATRATSAGSCEVRAQHDELVAAEAAREVGRAQHRREPFGGRGEQLVAGRVAERVVHVLEVVEVDEQHRERPSRRRDGEQLALAAPRGSSLRVARPVSTS